MVPLWLGVLPDDLVNQLSDFSLKPDLSALATDQGGHVLKFIKFVTPGLLMDDGFALQGASATGAYGWVEHKAIPSFGSRDRATWWHHIDGRL